MRLSPLQMIAWAELSADAKGCTCGPDIEVTEILPGIYNAVIGHDDWCDALDNEGPQ